MARLVKRVQSITTSDAPEERIRVIRAGVGNTVRMIPVADIICFEAADKYVNVVTANGEALVRMSLRELISRIESVDFMQVHRSVMVNANCITSATRDELGHYTLALRGLSRTIKVSRAFAHLFRPM
jgi:DNA-binding LytR/AlgR family response regulator